MVLEPSTKPVLAREREARFKEEHFLSMPARVHEQWTVLEHFFNTDSAYTAAQRVTLKTNRNLWKSFQKEPWRQPKSKQIMRIYIQLNQHWSQNVPKQPPQILQKIIKNQPQIYPKSIKNRSKIDPSGIPRATLCKRHKIHRSQGGFIAKSASKRDPQITPKSSQVDKNASPRAS